MEIIGDNLVNVRECQGRELLHNLLCGGAGSKSPNDTVQGHAPTTDADYPLGIREERNLSGCGRERHGT